MRRYGRPRLFKRLGDSRGAGLFEAALVMPVFLLSTFAIAEFSAILYVHLALQNGVSQATRFGIPGRLMPGQTRPESIKAAMRQATPTLTIDDTAFSFSHIPEGGSAWLGGPGGPGAIQRVTVSYSWPIMTPMLRPFFSSNAITFTAESTMKNETLFQP